MSGGGVVHVMRMEYAVKSQDFASAGEASSRIKKTLQAVGMPPDIVRRVAVAAYEAELNLVIHSLGGTMSVAIAPDRIELLVTDRGPGIPNIDLAMQEGYSTAPDYVREMGFGAGMGLPNIRRSADHFEIRSSVGIGTTLRVVVLNVGGG
ncbi:MAG: ATP-binding protein [Bacillota bacterium]